MKKIYIFTGSPRKNGNTNIMASLLQGHLKEKNIKSEITNLYNYEIHPCLDCRTCKTGDLVCTLDDGMSDLYEKLEQSDIFLIGSPIYWFGPTAKTKLFLDRFRPYFVNKKLSGKKAAIFFVAGSGETDCDLSIEMFTRTFEALNINLLGTIAANAYDVGEIKNDTASLDRIYELSNKICDEL